MNIWEVVIHDAEAHRYYTEFVQAEFVEEAVQTACQIYCKPRLELSVYPAAWVKVQDATMLMRQPRVQDPTMRIENTSEWQRQRMQELERAAKAN